MEHVRICAPSAPRSEHARKESPLYDVALSVLACLRANTDVQVAWIVTDAPGETEAVALTPGGGRMGSLLGGALDHTLAEALPDLGSLGGLLGLTVGTTEALMTGLTEGTQLTVALAPGEAFPPGFWEEVNARHAVSVAFDLDGHDFVGATIVDEEPAGLTADRLVCALRPVRRVVIAGGGPIAEALDQGFSLVGWRPSSMTNVVAATGLMATLSPIDGVIVMGHDVEVSGRLLQAAIGSEAGYIGSIGSDRMQELRAEWLSYRGVAWDDRVHGPAGLPIGADSPGEIAVSIVAEAVAALCLPDNPSTSA